MRKSEIEQQAVAKALALLNDPKVKLVGYRTQLILALLKHEGQRKEHAESARQRRHEREMARLKAELARLQGDPKGDPETASSEAVAAARDFLARIKQEREGAQ